MGIYFLRHHVHSCSGLTQTFFIWYRRLYLREQMGRSVKLTTDFHLVPRLRMLELLRPPPHPLLSSRRGG
jgi:hypothetical protein